MRTGQASGDVVVLPSDGETRFVVVPLTDGEYLKALSMSDSVDASEGISGLTVRDEVLKQAILLYCCREIHDWTEHFFTTVEEVAEMDTEDVNHAYDIYLELIAVASPSIQMMDDEGIENLKKVWSLIEWNELSGRQLYAAQRFLNSVQNDLLRASYSGSPSTLKSTTTSTEQDSAKSADESMTIQH